MAESPVTPDRCRQFAEELLFPEIGNDPTAADLTVGVELENFPYRIDSNGYRPVPLSGQDSLMNALLDVTGEFNGTPGYSKPGISGTSYINSIVFPDGNRFLFEPGGQIEISTAPCGNLTSLRHHLAQAQSILGTITERHKIYFGQQGTNPWIDGRLMQNQLRSARYLALENYFNGIGPYGRQMMLQTCGLHINLNTGGDDATRIKRIVAANLLVPFGTALFANSPCIDGRKTEFRSYRSYIWQHADQLRTGLMPLHQFPGEPNRKSLVDSYFEFAMNAPLIYIRQLNDRVLPRSYSLKYWLEHPIEGIRPDMDDVKNHFSLLFPEVRLKPYLELRSTDAPPVEWQMIPVLFYCGLLYSNKHLDKTLDLLAGITHEIDEMYKNAVYGLEADNIFSVSRQLMKLALDGLSDLPVGFRESDLAVHLHDFYEQFTLQRKSFADL